MEETEEESASKLDEKLRGAREGITEAIEDTRDSYDPPGELKYEALEVLKTHFVSYYVRDNSAFVFSAVKRCIDENNKCITIKSFLTSLPELEMFETVKAMKGCLVKGDGNFEQNAYFLCRFMLFYEYRNSRRIRVIY